MASESAVDRALMATAAQQVDEAASQIRGAQAQLASYHASLMAGWQGDAASAFTAAFETFNADFTAIINALAEFQPKLLANKAHYDAQEAALASQANRVAAAINR
jgi:WXG100 family type VII secretion target